MKSGLSALAYFDFTAKLAASRGSCVEGTATTTEEVLDSHSCNWLLVEGTHPAACTPNIDLKYYSQREELCSSLHGFYGLYLVWVSSWNILALEWILE